MQALLLTEREVCASLNVSRSTLRRLMAQGFLQPVHIGRSLRFPIQELDRFVTGLQAENDNDSL